MSSIKLVFSFFWLLLLFHFGCNDNEIIEYKDSNKKNNKIDSKIENHLIQCSEMKGDAMGETIIGNDTIYGAWEDCIFNSPNLELAFNALLIQKIKPEDSLMFSLLSKDLSLKSKDKYFDEHQMGYKLKINSDNNFDLELQFPGGVTNYSLNLDKTSVRIRALYSAD